MEGDNKTFNNYDLKHFTLHSGDKMPSIGYGCWKVPNDKIADVVYESIKAGYRLFDEAQGYGNEVECGQGIKRAIDEGLVKREDLFITSKLWNSNHAKDKVEEACKRTLSDMQLDYLDLYLIHFPIAIEYIPMDVAYPSGFADMTRKAVKEVPIPYRETWEGMEKLVDDKLVRNIGCSNINCQLLRDVLTYAKHKPAVNQIELHPYLTQQRLVKFCQNNNIAVTAYSSLGSGGYQQMDASFHAQSMMIQESALDEKVIQDLAKAKGKSPAQIALRWALQRGTAIIPKSSNPDRVKENMDLFGFEFTPEEMQAIDALNKDRRYNDVGHTLMSRFNYFLPLFE